MFRNVLTAALRNLVRNRLYAAISIASLAIGMAAALLTFLYVRDELTFDHFVPGDERVFVVRTNAVFPGRGAIHYSKTTLELAGWIKQAAPQVRLATRAWPMSVAVRRGGTEVSDQLLWADPDFFTVFPLPVVAGDLQGALRRPDGLVITRSAARRYFGSDAPIGQVLQIDRKASFRVAAVIEDPPGNSSLDGALYGSGLSPQSRIYIEDHKPYVAGNYLSNVYTYVRLAVPAEAPAVEARLVQVVRQRLFPEPYRDNPMAKTLVLTLAPIGKVHLMPELGGSSGSLIVIWALGAIAALVLVAAGVNFVNLSTARAVRRSLEVGVRKVAGASRAQLMLQFLGEALVYAAAGMALAAMLVELVDPAMTGLFGLAAFVSEQRTKEIGVRKAMGASKLDIVRLPLWSFTQPVLLANLIAWPLGWWALDRWLQGFAQRISLSPWLFLAAGAAAVAIAALTVSGHALRVARAKPVGALRYE